MALNINNEDVSREALEQQNHLWINGIRQNGEDQINSYATPTLKENKKEEE